MRLGLGSWFTALCLVGWGCDDSPQPAGTVSFSDGARPQDAGPAGDAQPKDAGRRDGDTPHDLGTDRRDARVPVDAQTPPDSAVTRPDGQVVDAVVNVDAVVKVDAEVAPVDGAVPRPDPDAGVEADAERLPNPDAESPAVDAGFPALDAEWPPPDAAVVAPDAVIEPPPPPPDPPPLADCPVYDPPVVAGNVADVNVTEASGLSASHRTPGVLWTHNDSGDRGRVFAVSTRGEALGVFEVDGPGPRDWEDIAVGPGPDPALSYVYLGDVGDNLLARATIGLRRFPEPEVVRMDPPPTTRLVGVETFTLVYPDGPHNCETLMVDPRNGDVYVVVKSGDGVSPVYRAAAPLQAGNIRLERVANLTFGPNPLAGNTLTTGGDISPAGDAILIRTYSSVYLWRRAPNATVGEALATPPCRMPLAGEQQGEAIGFAADGRGYYTVSEGINQPISFYNRVQVVPPTVFIDGRRGQTHARYLVPTNDDLGAGWTAPGFDDRAWPEGPQGLGYEDAPAEYAPLIGASTRPAEVNPDATSVLARLPFSVVDPQVDDLVLRVKYDDGYVAWLNGVEVARRNVPNGPPRWNGRAASHADAAAIVYEDVNIGAFAHLLVRGQNVLAVHVMNADPTSSDMLLDVELIRP